MQRLLSLVPLALLAVPLAAPLVAQEGAAPPSEAATKAQARFQELTAKADEAYQAWMAEVQEMARQAEEAGEELSAFPDPPYADFIPDFLAAADDCAGTPEEADFLIWVVEHSWGSDPAAQEGLRTAIDRLAAGHLADPKMEAVARMLPQLRFVLGQEQTRALAAKLERATPSVKVKAWAVYARLEPVLKDGDPSSPAYQKARREIMALLDQADDEWLNRMIRDEILVREEFAIGKKAPDIEGVDLDGKAFRLSDYQGKIIFLDFWGDW